jgi:hypothetical protein
MSKRTIGIALAAVVVAFLATGAALAGAQGNSKGVHYLFRGQILSTPTAGQTQISVEVEGGNHIALKKLLGASIDQNFAIGANTEFLKWSNGIPTVVHATDLAVHDWVFVHIRAPRDASLAEVEAQPAGLVGDHGQTLNPPSKPLYLFRGTLTAAASATSVTLDVKGGNHRALRLLLGQSTQQTFTYGQETIFLLWQGKVPTVISASQLKVGDRIAVRVRADAGSSLAQVEATPAVHIGEHEPPTSQVNNT